ncbi:protein AKNAD1 [Cyrtonyx montezumae]|uniref:protein AKNAD1 n=1 Tax=Cyrtonyx montezumae TaxID=9017 RepID=UPI0032DA91F1
MEAQTSCSLSSALSYGTDTTDAEQGDLPYEGDVRTAREYPHKLNYCTCIKKISGILNSPCSGDSKNASANCDIHAQPESVLDCNTGTRGTMGISARTPGREATFMKELPAGEAGPGNPLPHSEMPNVLWRHFSEGELTGTWQLIECETIPETSLTESTDETTNRLETSEHVRGILTGQQQAAKFEEHLLERLKVVNTGGKSQNLLCENKSVSETSASTTAKHGCRQENSQLINEYKDTHILQNTEEWRCVFKKSLPSHQLIQEQGEIQRHQEDNNEVTSEMKAPEMSENHKSVPTIERTASFPTLLKQPMTTNSILENQNCFDSIEVANPKEMSVPVLKILPQSGSPNPGLVYSGDTGTSTEALTVETSVLLQSTHGLSEPRLPCGTTASALPAIGAVEERCLNPSNLLPEITQGEKMSQMLKEQTDQLKMKVEDCSKHKTEGTFLLQNNYQALNQLKRYLDALERNYLTAREEHRNLQLQYYNDTPINIGEFDPERKVEGEIFRLGMLLEDIQEQEQADGSKCRSSPSLTSCESAHSSYSLWESSAVSSITDSPEENAFRSKNNDGENTSQTSCIISKKNAHFSLKCRKCNLCIRTNNIQERIPYPTGIHPIFIQGKPTDPTDLSDTNLSSESEDILAYHSYGSQSDELTKCESYKIFHTRQQRERKGFKCRYPRERQNQFKLQNYKESVQSCVLCRNKNSGSASYSQKRTPSQDAQTNEQHPELINGPSESLPNKNSARRKSAINIRNRNAKDFNINILTSTLDHAIQTANNLKKETERMVQAISEDLAKARRKQL